MFDGTVTGTFSIATAATARQLVSNLVDGYATALQHMHRGDYWRVYIPSDLGYGASGSGTSVPGYSTLIFDLLLVEYCSAGETLPAWSAREKAHQNR